MNDRLDLLVTDFTSAPGQASPRTSRARSPGSRPQPGALRHPTAARRPNRPAGCPPRSSWAAGPAIAGALPRRRAPPRVAEARRSAEQRLDRVPANGAAGSDLSRRWWTSAARATFAVEVGGQPRRIVGDDVDHDIQMCPTVSPDGAHLAYLVLDSTTITPTPAPVPAGQTFGPNPSYVGPLLLWFEIVGLDANGTPSGEARRIAIPPTADGGVGCPRWSPDGTRLAFTIDLSLGGRQLFVVGPDATLTTLRGGAIRLGARWAPAGRRRYGRVARPGRRGRCPTTDRRRPERGGLVARRLTDRGPAPVELLVVTPEGRVVFRESRPQDDTPVVLWAPDGSRPAEAFGGKIYLTTPDGTQSKTSRSTSPRSSRRHARCRLHARHRPRRLVAGQPQVAADGVADVRSERADRGRPGRSRAAGRRARTVARPPRCPGPAGRWQGVSR